MAKKPKQRVSAFVDPVHLKGRIDRAVSEGRFQQALELAKQLLEAEPTPVHRELLRNVYLGRAQQLRAQGKTRDAVIVLDNLVNHAGNDVAWLEKAALEFAACGETQKGLRLMERVPNAPPPTRMLAAAVDAALFQGIAGRATLPENLHVPFDTVVQAFKHLETGADDAAKESLQSIGLQSPFLEWKLFLRGLQAYYQGDDARALENWARLDAQRVPARLAAPLRFGMDATYRTAQPSATQIQLRRQADRLQGAGPLDNLRSLQAALAAHDLPLSFRLAEQVVPHLRKDAPKLVPRLAACVYWAVVQFGQQSDIAKYRRLFGAPADDPLLARMDALGCEEARDLTNAHRSWQQFEASVATNPSWPAAQANRVRALVWRRMGDNAASMPNDEMMKQLPAFLRDHIDRPRALRPGAAECYQRSLELAPDQLASYQALIDLHAGPNGSVEEMEKAARRLLEHFPDHVETLGQLAAILTKNKEYEEALVLSQRALKANPLDRKLRERVGTGHLFVARLRAEAGRFDEARQQYQTVLAFQEGRDNYDIYWKWAAVEFKARDPERAEELLLKTANAPRLASAYALVVEAARFKLTALKKRFDKDFTDALAEKPPSAAGIASALTTAAALRRADVKYLGQKTHEKKLLTYLDRVPGSAFTEKQLLDVCGALMPLATARTLQKYRELGRRRFPRSPHFPFLLALQLAEKGPHGVEAYRVPMLVHDAECLARAAPPDPEIEDLLKRLDSLRELTGLGPSFDIINPWDDEYDDD